MRLLEKPPGRRRLGDAKYATAVVVGGAMTAEDAISYALAVTDRIDALSES